MFLISPVAERGEVMMKSSLSSGQVQIHCVLFKLLQAHKQFFVLCRKVTWHKNIFGELAAGQDQKLQLIFLDSPVTQRAPLQTTKEPTSSNIFCSAITLLLLLFLLPPDIPKESGLTTDTPH